MINYFVSVKTVVNNVQNHCEDFYNFVSAKAVFRYLIFTLLPLV